MPSQSVMTPADPSLRAQVRDFYDDYACALDDGDLDGWTRFFADDCHYRVVSLENWRERLPLSTMQCHGIGAVRDRVAALRETTVYEPRTLRHLVSGVRVGAPDGDEIPAQASFAILESLSDRETQIFLAGRYIDRIVRDGAGLRLRERICVYDNYRIRTSLIFPV